MYSLAVGKEPSIVSCAVNSVMHFSALFCGLSYRMTHVPNNLPKVPE